MATTTLDDADAPFTRDTLVVGTWGPHEGVLYRVEKTFLRTDPGGDEVEPTTHVVVRTQLTDRDDATKVTLAADELVAAADYDGNVFYTRPTTASRHTRSGITNRGEHSACPICGATHRRWANDSMAGVHGEWCAVCDYDFEVMG